MYARIHPFPFDVFFFFISFSASMQNVHTEQFSFSRLAQNLLEPRVHLKDAFLSWNRISLSTERKLKANNKNQQINIKS